MPEFDREPHMERLWAPWRLEYVAGDPSQPEPLSLPAGADPACFICRAAAANADRQNLVVGRGSLTITILNRFPYNNGHVLVAPQRHEGSLQALTPQERAGSIEEVSRLIPLLTACLKAEGFNVGLNLGRIAGAGLPGHIHWHIVPRWNGDTNFMPVLAGAKVIPQSLDALWQVLTAALAGE